MLVSVLTSYFVQEWYGSLDQSVVLEEYRHFKHSFTYEYYLDVVPYDIRFYITRIRLSAHSLRMQTGRYGQNRIPRHERFCMLCYSNELEDMYHFICVCPSFVEIRNKYLPPSFIRKPSMYKLCQLFQCKEKKTYLPAILRHSLPNYYITNTVLDWLNHLTQPIKSWINLKCRKLLTLNCLRMFLGKRYLNCSSFINHYFEKYEMLELQPRPRELWKDMKMASILVQSKIF